MNKDYFNDDFSEGSSFSSPGTEQALLERSQLQARVDTEPKVEEFQIRSIKLRVDEDFPISLDIEAEVNNILAAGIFRQLENPALYDKISDLMLSPVYCELVKMLFWTVFVVKFQKEEAELLDKLRKRLGSLYSEFFTRMQQPKEELSNIGIIGAAYLCHIMFFNLFPKERDMFDMRFILDCYHVVIHEVNGIFVSDFYIQTSIERLFGNKFFHYEKRVEKKKKVEKRDYRNEPLLRDLEFDLKDLPQVPGGLDLAYELSSKLRKVPRKQRTINTHDSVESNRGNLPGNRAIMRLTQQPEEKSILSKSEEVGAYFPKLKFNCHQISPTVSSFLESSTSVLPFQKRKVINYSNNKHIAESPALIYQAVMEPETATKPEKKERHKSQPKGSIADFNLKNRPEDYYLGYMSPEMKKKFRFALDLKYIFDHVKPTLRSSHSVKSLGNNDFHRRFVPQATNTLNTQATQEAINEDDEEMLEGQNQSKDDTSTSALHSLKDITSRKDKKDEYYEKGADGVTLPFIKAKTKTFSKDEIAHALQRSGTKKGTLPRLDDESGGLYEDKKKYIPSTLRFQAAVNKNLGKGRYFVSLKGHEEDPDPAEQRKALANYKYSDKRKDYITHHDGLIRKDVDSKIENLVHKLLVNKNNFSQNFGRFGNSSRLSQAK